MINCYRDEFKLIKSPDSDLNRKIKGNSHQKIGLRTQGEAVKITQRKSKKMVVVVGYDVDIHTCRCMRSAYKYKIMHNDVIIMGRVINSLIFQIQN